MIRVGTHNVPMFKFRDLQVQQDHCRPAVVILAELSIQLQVHIATSIMHTEH